RCRTARARQTSLAKMPLPHIAEDLFVRGLTSLGLRRCKLSVYPLAHRHRQQRAGEFLLLLFGQAFDFFDGVAQRLVHGRSPFETYSTRSSAGKRRARPYPPPTGLRPSNSAAWASTSATSRSMTARTSGL